MSNSVKLFLKVFAGILVVGLVVALGIVGGALMGFIDTTGDLNIEELQFHETSFVYSVAEGGAEVEYERLYGEENRVWCDITDTPAYLGKAFIAIEDERFEKHIGFDIKSTSKAVFDYVLRRNGRGASTITQQLVKNLTGDKDATPTRKIQEIIRSINLEKKLSKQQILELYINTIYLSQGCYGVGSAADFYFDRDVADLTLAQAASIAGITQYPTRYDPLLNPENNKEKQELVLSKMLELGFIDDATYRQAVEEELVFTGKIRQEASRQSYFVDLVVSDVLRDLQEKKGYSESVAAKMLYSGGLKIYATIDPVVQAAMDKVYLDPASFPSPPKSVEAALESAMVVMDPYTGQIRGVVGGRGEKTASRTLNRATQSYRQPGSAIKPVAVYAPAVESGLITPASSYVDQAVTYGSWSPKNYYAGFRGPVTVNYALQDSINTVPVQILERLGPAVAVNFMKNNLGITSLQDSDRNLSIALGGFTKGVSPLELTAAYAPFVNRGIYTPPSSYTRVLDSKGGVLLENRPEGKKAMSEQTATIMSGMLKNVVDYGTGASARFNSSYATGGKTGTTDKDIDRWFVGFTPYYAATVWTGFDEPRSMSFYGGNPCIPVFKKVMTQIHAEKKLESKGFHVSSGVASASYCIISGKLPNEFCPSTRTSYFRSGTQPTAVCDLHEPEEAEEGEGLEGEQGENSAQGSGGQSPTGQGSAGQTPSGTASPQTSASPKPQSSASPKPTPSATPVPPPLPTPAVDLGEPNV